MANLYDYFQRACQRPSDQPRGSAGDKIVDEDGHAATFWLDVHESRIESASYKCTTCFTLVALCEHLAEMVVGLTPEQAAAIFPHDVLKLHPEVPENRAARAELAVRALHSALAYVNEGTCA